ncbi:hypothetical protein B0H13DRAFT_2026388 [Mycena leptocephala]|nr:hypothetical protein B0H13DRAFT_2026388 [Mycena leptocephala]
MHTAPWRVWSAMIPFATNTLPEPCVKLPVPNQNKLQTLKYLNVGSNLTNRICACSCRTLADRINSLSNRH